MLKGLVLFSAIVLMSIKTNAQPPEGPRPPRPEEQLKMATEKISRELHLNTKQQDKLRTAYGHFFMEIEKIHPKNTRPKEGPPPIPTEAEIRVVKNLAAIRDAKIKTILTVKQYKQYQELEKTMGPPRREGPPSGKPQ